MNLKSEEIQHLAWGCMDHMNPMKHNAIGAIGAGSGLERASWFMIRSYNVVECCL